MPQTTPQIKVDAVRRSGAEVVLPGDSYADAAAALRRSCVQRPGMTFIHPFDDPLVIAGQGTIGARDPAPEPRSWTRSSCRSAAAGSSAGSPATSRRCVPDVEVIGVEPFDSRRHVSLAAQARTRVRARSRRASSPTAWRCSRWASSRSPRAADASTRSSASTTTRSARPSRTSSTTRASIMEPAGRAGASPGSRRGSQRRGCDGQDARRRRSAAPT